jgi:peptide-methionine (R)-S-oxide reductase
MSLFVPSRGVAEDYVTPADSVPPGERFLPRAQAIGTGIGAARVLVGVTFLVAPVTSVRVLGMDTATAKRVTHLARMAAVRDIALGAGALAGLERGAGGGWLLAGAGTDAADAVLIAGALRSGKARGLVASGIALGALASAAIGAWAAAGLAGRR